MKKLIYVCGFLMAFADSIPGVSGGTIAYILGLYDKLIESVYSLMSRDKTLDKKEAISFLIKLGIAWSIGLVISILLIASVIEHRIYDVTSLFLGFIVVSIPFVIMQEKEALINHKKDFLFLILGIVLVVFIAMYNPKSANTVEPTNFQAYLYIFFAGSIAISALLLPGISGSTLLLIFGVYFTIINAVHDVIKFNFEQLPVLICFGMGILVGVFFSIKIIRFALVKHKGKITYLIVGLMFGSLYAIVQGPTTLEIPQEALTLETFNILFFIVGIAMIMSLEFIKNFMLRNETKA